VLTAWFVLARIADMEQAAALGEACLALCEEARDERHLAIVLLYQGNMAQFQNQFELACEKYQRSLELWRKLDDLDGIARCLSELALLLSLYGQFADAHPYFEEARAIYEQRDDAVGIARSWTDRGLATFLQGDVEDGRKMLEQALALSESVGVNTNTEAAILYLGVAELYDDAPDRALVRLRESLCRRQRAGEEYGITYCLLGIAGAMSRLGQKEEAARLAAAVTGVQQSLGLDLPPSLRAFYDAEVRLIREGLDEDTFSSAWSEGSTLRMEQAISLALGSPGNHA
jgi:tetratricopeptide (TPR) repeat protein